MKTKTLTITLILITLLGACQAATPLPTVSTAKDVEFTLATDQVAALTDAGFSIRLMGVAGDERCPSEIECAISGPVSISLSIQEGDGSSTKIDLQTFTDNNGRAPDGEFEGINDRAVYKGYLIRVVGVAPYPVNLSNPIEESEYRVTLVVTQE